MQPLTVQALLDYLKAKCMEALITPDYQVAVWLDDRQGGKVAISLEDITYHTPDIDKEGFIAFHPIEL